MGVICGGFRRLITIDRSCVSDCPAESATRTVKFDVLAGRIGVPEITPVVASKFRPAGSVPAEMLQVLAPVPPVAATVWL